MSRFGVLARWPLRGRLPVVLVAVVTLVSPLAAVLPAQAVATVTTPGGFTSLSPSRLLDTSAGVGAG